VSEKPHIQSLDAADLSRAIELGRVDRIQLGGLVFDRATFSPGWAWSVHAGRGQSCAERHLGYLVSGRMRFRMNDGTELEARAGDVYLIPPGHDAWVPGDDPCVALDLRNAGDDAGT
jgi:Cupin domain